MNKSYGIHDKWTDLDRVNNIEIKSNEGVIEEITVNGEPAGGDGDLTAANVTFINSAEGSNPYQVKLMELTENGTMETIHDVNYGVNVTCKIPLYKGSAIYSLNIIKNANGNIEPTATGGVSINMSGLTITVTGDGSFTAAGD